jgi:hypothetical protein
VCREKGIFCPVNQHQAADFRLLELSKAIVARIDNDPAHTDICSAVKTCTRWYKSNPAAALSEWLDILNRPWEDIRTILLDESENGKRLRQNIPFCGVLSNRERWAILKRCKSETNSA